MKCPVCKGNGHLPEPRKIERDRTQERYAMAKVLRANGYSIRQIADFLGYKSPRSVSVALEQ
jgi:transposase